MLVEGERAVRITHLITDLDTGGAEVMLARLLDADRSGRFEQSVVSLTTIGPVGIRIQQRGIPTFAIGVRPSRPAPAALWRLARLLHHLKPDILQTWLYHADLAGLIAGGLLRVPRVVWNIRCSSFDLADHHGSFGLLLRVLAALSRRPTAVVYNSKAGRQAHERFGYTPKRSVVIPNGFDVSAFKPRPNASFDLRRQLRLSNDARIVGLLARYHPMKDHPNFFSAAATIAGKRDDVHFVAAGRGVDVTAGLLDTVNRVDLAGRVTLLPEQSDPAAFLAGLDVAVCSSYSEAFPNVVAEAMACGTPCVATAAGDSADIIGRAGRIVPTRDAAALASAIEELLQLDQQQRMALSEAARARIVSEFSIERIAVEYAEFYASLVDSIRSEDAIRVG
jgi:glycosyltransferase involved in cell wall biosynthesis